MSVFAQEVFDAFALDNNVVGLFEKTKKLKSGRESNWYVNWRGVCSKLPLVETLAYFLIDFADVHKLGPIDCFYGVPEGATKLALLAQHLAWKRDRSAPFVMGRGQPKDHGDPRDRFFVGDPPRGRTLVIEDVTTTGGSLIAALEALRATPDVQVVAAVGLTNRMELRDDGKSVEQAVSDLDVPYFAMSHGPRLLKALVRRGRPFEAVIKAIEAEFDRYGIEPLKLEETA